jgi:flavin-dependent dehydrogenase
VAEAKANIAQDYLVARDFSYQSKRSSGDGWVLVGDAKGFIDPVYSTGVFLALRSGELAGDAICHALQVDDTSAEMLATWIPDYERRVNWLQQLVDLFYDGDFQFGSFFADHPDQVSTLSDLLMGRIYEIESQPHELFKKITQWKRQQQTLC